MKIFPVAEPDLSGNEAAYVVDAIEHEKMISGGKYVRWLESHCEAAFGRTHAISCSNGTTALHLALLGLGIGPGDEVIVPAFTFAATAAAVLHVGATPVFVDVHESDWNIDVSLLDAKRTAKTRAVIAVDIYGMPADYAFLEAWCKEHNLFLIEDAAEAHGATYRGRPAGSFGDVSIFSFYGNKILTTGEGGVVLMNDEALYKKILVLKNHGMVQAGIYEHEVAGYNYRLTNIQAAIGCAQFERFAAFLEARRRNEALYRQLLQDPTIIFPQSRVAECDPAPWLVSMRVTKAVTQLPHKLLEFGIQTRPLFKPMHLQPAYAAFARGDVFPVSERIWQEGISLPSSSMLEPDNVRYISETFKKIIS